MSKISISLREFLADPEHHLKEARQKDSVLLVHTENGCLIAAILTKLMYQGLLQKGEI